MSKRIQFIPCGANNLTFLEIDGVRVKNSAGMDAELTWADAQAQARAANEPTAPVKGKESKDG